MENEKLTSNTPFVLTLIVVLLAVARIATWSFETFNTKEIEGIRWTEASKIDLAGGRDYQPRLVFYYFCQEGDESCGRVDKVALLNKNVVGMVNDNLLPIKVIKKGESDESEMGVLEKGLQQRLGVFVYPTFLITLPDGKEVGMLPGYFGVNAKNLVSFIKSSQKKEKYVAGLDFLAHAQYDRSAQALQQWLRTKDEYNWETENAALYCALAHKMLFEDNDVKNTLERVRMVSNVKDQVGVGPLKQFLLGEIDPKELMQSCGHDDDKISRAYYFIGMLQLRSGDIQTAVNSFKQAEKVVDPSPEVHALIAGQLSLIFDKKN